MRHYESAEQDPPTARRLALLRRTAGPVPAPVALGQPVPDFTLTDSTGATVKLSSFAGKVVAMNFVYTRCALPQFCLRMANTFAVLQKRFSNVLGRDVQLLTVTFDPERDTPEVLAAYAGQMECRRARLAVPDRRRRTRCGVCARLFGVEAFADEGLTQPHGPHRDRGPGWPTFGQYRGKSVYAGTIGRFIAIAAGAVARGRETTLECAFAPRCSSRPESAVSVLSATPARPEWRVRSRPWAASCM